MWLSATQKHKRNASWTVTDHKLLEDGNHQLHSYHMVEQMAGQMMQQYNTNSQAYVAVLTLHSSLCTVYNFILSTLCREESTTRTKFFKC